MTTQLEIRFKPKRWSPTRKLIAGMNVGDVYIVKSTEKNNAKTTIQRLRDAWPDRKWKQRTVVNGFEIERIK